MLYSRFSLIIYFICSITSVYILIFTLSFPAGVFSEAIIQSVAKALGHQVTSSLRVTGNNTEGKTE